MKPVVQLCSCLSMFVSLVPSANVPRGQLAGTVGRRVHLRILSRVRRSHYITGWRLNLFARLRAVRG